MSLINKEKTMEEIPINVCDRFEVTGIIEKMPTVNAIPLEKVKQAREEVKEYINRASDHKQKVAFKACLMLFDNLIEGVEDENKESEQTGITC